MSSESIDYKGTNESDLELAMNGGEIDEEPEQAEPQGELGDQPATAPAEAEPATPAPVVTEPKADPAAAGILADLQRTRQRAQVAEQELNRIREAQQAAAQRAERPDFLDDTLAAHTEQQLAAIRAENARQNHLTRMEMSREFTRQAHPDFDQKIEALMALSDDPLLGPIVRAADAHYGTSANPAKAFYDLATRLTGGTASPAASPSATTTAATPTPPIPGPKGLSRAGSMAPSASIPPPPRRMSDADLDARLNQP